MVSVHNENIYQTMCNFISPKWNTWLTKCAFSVSNYWSLNWYSHVITAMIFSAMWQRGQRCVNKRAISLCIQQTQRRPWLQLIVHMTASSWPSAAFDWENLRRSTNSLVLRAPTKRWTVPINLTEKTNDPRRFSIQRRDIQQERWLNVVIVVTLDGN